MSHSSVVKKSVLVAILLNLLLPILLKRYASPEEIKPPNGASNLSFKGQIMHMMVHHNQVKLTSSAIVALVVFLSVRISQKH